MNLLYACSSRSLLNFKLTSSYAVRNHRLPVQLSLRAVLFNRHSLETSRHFSWEGFYYSVSSSAPIMTLQNVLLDFHNSSGLPWWAVIALSTLGIRSFIIFPLAVHQNQVINRLANLNAELGKMAPELNKEVNIAKRMFGWDESFAKKVFKKSMREYYQKFIMRDNCHPFKIILLALFQIPVWICFSISLRNLTINPFYVNCDAELLQKQLKSEGTLWFTDLTVPDTFLIPFLLTLVNVVLIEIHALRVIGKGAKLQKALLYMMRFVVIIVAGAAAINPTSVSFYWLCSSIFGLMQNLLFMLPRFRRLLRIPHTANESATPFKDIASNFRKRFL